MCAHRTLKVANANLSCRHTPSRAHRLVIQKMCQTFTETIQNAPNSFRRCWRWTDAWRANEFHSNKDCITQPNKFSSKHHVMKLCPLYKHFPMTLKNFADNVCTHTAFTGLIWWLCPSANIGCVGSPHLRTTRTTWGRSHPCPSGLSWGEGHLVHTHTRWGTMHVDRTSSLVLGGTLYGQLILLPFEPVAHWDTTTSKLGFARL